ncbi:ribosomal protein S18 acetylase RimI-like enzyme [Bacillus sp. SORGH_AS 510]|uniref:GNAT family N-acetyltransferase n=1 Tax=Bacillus sp. SORGH_AS_0510 TaxID=3041771 RepID=UPI00278B98A3|nr:GNAT family N-acetyltransferase [Bacillus sp. SORGH_AS_0510]MDQ1146325.1 ribosomal protein S18 acetylase RimI-like enzyme [Bacillus sp. SORGH_AS_0510]
MNIQIKRLTECTIQEIITAWNRGFEGYFVKLEMTPELFFNRLVNEGLSLPHSVVAYDGEEPVAIVMNGFREINGKKTAWNGGTGIANDYRGKGISTLLMEEILKIYNEEGCEVATLEAIKENERAIRLYKRFGYEITDSLVYLSGTLESQNHSSIKAKNIRPEQLANYSFYKQAVPWQCQWQSVKSGEAQIYYDNEQNPLGYALYKRVWNPEGQLEKVFLFQVELIGGLSYENMQAIFSSMTEHQDHPVTYMTVNASQANPVIQYLSNHGFKNTTEQVQMVKTL